jgi:hypothetical protein
MQEGMVLSMQRGPSRRDAATMEEGEEGERGKEKQKRV